MDINSLFIKATRLKLRFQTNRGLITVEDLWDLPLTSTTGKVNLDQLAINAFNKIEQAPTVSFVENVAKVETEAELQLSILKYVIAAKQAENKTKADAAAKSAEKAKLLELLKSKQEHKLTELSEEELMERINAL